MGKGIEAMTQIANALQQDRAAGGVHRRKLRITSGDVVTVSLVVSGSASPYRVIMRFKSGLTVQRPVAKLDAPSPYEALKLAWSRIREEQIVEKYGWRWIDDDPQFCNPDV
jgi:hypothetical protein